LRDLQCGIGENRRSSAISYLF